MKVVSSEIITKKGIDKDGKEYEMGKYERITYDNGSVAENIVGNELQADSNTDYMETQPTQLDRIEEILTNNALSMEYLLCMQEINSSDEI